MYKTVSLYEASYLICEGFHIAGREVDKGKVTILFEYAPGLDQKVMSFHNGNGKASAKELFNAYRSLKDFVFDFIKTNRR